MNPAFIGDITDLAKFALLRRLSGIAPPASPRLKLGVLWYIREEPTFSSHSTGTYGGVNLANLDADLVRALSQFNERRPTLADVENSDLFGDGMDATFFSRRMTRPRERWFADGIESLLAEGSHLIYLDPDTGVAADGERSTKHAHVGEIRAVMERGCCFSTIHFPGRTRRTIAEAREQLEAVATALNRPDIALVRFRYASGRFFFVGACEEHSSHLMNRVGGLARDWSPLFDLI